MFHCLTRIGAIVASPAHGTVCDVTGLRHAPLMRYGSVKNQVHRLLMKIKKEQDNGIECVCVVREGTLRGVKND